MSTSISVLLMKVAEARTSEEQYESALRLLAYNLPHLKTQQHQLPHLKQFIVDEDKPGTLKTLEALKERLYAFHSAHPHEAKTLQLNFIYGLKPILHKHASLDSSLEDRSSSSMILERLRDAASPDAAPFDLYSDGYNLYESEYASRLKAAIEPLLFKMSDDLQPSVESYFNYPLDSKYPYNRLTPTAKSATPMDEEVFQGHSPGL